MALGPKIAILLVVSLLPHLAVWNADFTFDDREFVQSNASIRSLSAAVGAFDESFPPESAEYARYRPLTNFSYALQYALWSDDSRGYHRFNLVLYFLIVALVYCVAIPYLGSGNGALATATLFALHPAHCEAVDSIAGHSELLSLFFVLAALSSFHRAVGFGRSSDSVRPRRGLGFALLALGCFALALLAKETAVMLAPVILVHLAIYHQRGSARSWTGRFRACAYAAPYFLAVVVYLGVREEVLGRLRPEVTVLGDADLATHLLTVGRVFAEYIRLLVFPYPLQVDYYYQHAVGVHDTWTWGAALGWSLLLLLLAWTAMALWSVVLRRDRSIGSHTQPLLFGLLFFGAFLFPVSHVVPFGALMAERFLLAPSVGFCLALGALALRLVSGLEDSRGRALFAAASLVVAVGLAAVTAARAADWRDSVSLWRPVTERLPHDHRAWANLGRGYLRRGDLPEAVEALTLSLRLEPAHVTSLNNLASIHLEAGRFRQARELYHRALEVEPTSHVAWTNLGVIETRLLNHAASRAYYRRALELNPNHAPARELLLTADAMVARAKGFLAAAPPLELESAPLEMLHHHVLSQMVVGNRQRAEEIYAVLLGRSERSEDRRIPQLEYQIRVLAGRAGVARSPAQ